MIQSLPERSVRTHRTLATTHPRDPDARGRAAPEAPHLCSSWSLDVSAVHPSSGRHLGEIGGSGFDLHGQRFASDVALGGNDIDVPIDAEIDLEECCEMPTQLPLNQQRNMVMPCSQVACAAVRCGNIVRSWVVPRIEVRWTNFHGGALWLRVPRSARPASQRGRQVVGVGADRERRRPAPSLARVIRQLAARTPHRGFGLGSSRMAQAGPSPENELLGSSLFFYHL